MGDAVYGGSGEGALPWSANGKELSVTETFQSKDAGIRTAVIITCALSGLGSLAMMLSFVCFRQLRSKPREILLHISIMDLGVSLANLVGAAVYFDQYFHTPEAQVHNASTAESLYGHAQSPANDDGSGRTSFTATAPVEALCIAQAFLAGYFTVGSVLWTIFMSVYIYLYLLYHRTNPLIPRRSIPAACLVSYGLPLVLMVWLVSTGRLGYAPYNSSGWCTLIVQDPATGESDIYTVIFGNDLWIYLAIVLIPILYFASLNYIHKNLDLVQRKMCRSLVYKFLFIPVIFLVLRVWTCILIILYTYKALREEQVPSGINSTLLYLSGIGDSGQGLANAVLFVVLSQKARSKLWRCLLCRRQVVDINSERTPINTQSASGSGQGEESTSTQRYFEATDHLLCESLDNTSLLIEFDKSSSVI